MVEAGTLLICTASGSKKHLGKAALIDRPMDYAFGGFMGLLKPNRNLLPKYLHWLMRSDGYWSFIDALSDGSNINNLKFSQLSDFPIPLPPLDEQQRIVEVLDEAFAGLARARANAEANLRNARDLFETLREVTLDPSRTSGLAPIRLERLIDIKHGFAFKSEFFAESGSHVVLTPGNYFETGGYRDRGAKQKYYSGEVPREYVLHQGDLLMAMTEQAPGLLGSCIIVPENDRFLHNQRLGLVAPKRGVGWHSEFFFHVFNLKAFRQELSDSCTGATVRHTSPSRIQAVIVPYVEDTKEQRGIAEYLTDAEDDCRQLEARYRAKISDLADLRQSLLQKAFAGELT